jgi:hypothetical protein
MNAKANESGGAKMGYIGGESGISDTCCQRRLRTTLGKTIRCGLWTPLWKSSIWNS